MNAPVHDPLAAWRIESEPFYRPAGNEVALYRQAWRHRMPLILKGPTGCGKTRFVEHMAWSLGRPLVTLACNEDMTASDLVGRYLLDADVTTVGRHPEADIFFDDVTVSRRHAEITRTGNVFELVDQRSLNGSYVNGERVDRSILVDGAEVRIGKFRLNFFASPVDRDQVTPDQAIRG